MHPDRTTSPRRPASAPTAALRVAAAGFGARVPMPWPDSAPAAPWAGLVARDEAARSRIGRLAQTLDDRVIPWLASRRRVLPPAPAEAARADALRPGVDEFVALLLADRTSELAAFVGRLRSRGALVESIYLGLLAPAAQRLGELWCDDRCDFGTVTWATGRLHALMREWGPAFDAELRRPVRAQRILLVQPPGEQHSFGLAMVSDFFRREGWQVAGGVGGSVDAAQAARREWFDVVGISGGAAVRLPWIAQCIADVRRHSANAGVRILVGGPAFVADPRSAAAVGADGTAADAAAALRVAAPAPGAGGRDTAVPPAGARLGRGVPVACPAGSFVG